MTEFYTHTFSNGFSLLAEPMDGLESVAYQLAIPAGTIHEPLDRHGRESRAGLAGFTCEMVLRGAGERSSRKIIDDFDMLGIDRNETVGNYFTQYSGATLAANLKPALSLTADLVRRPHLPKEELEQSRLSVMQELRAIEDEPADRLSVELRRRAFPRPWNRIPQGSPAGCQAITHRDVARFYQTFYRPNGAILGVAGRFDWPRLLETVARLFEDWKPLAEPVIQTVPLPFESVTIPLEDATQTQLGVAWRSVPPNHPDYPLAWGLTNILSGGMSSRLFTGLRERQGLCYSVWATQIHTRQDGRVFCQLGTSPERLNEALPTLLDQIRSLAGDQPSGDLQKVENLQTVGGPVTAEEVQRLKTRSKAALIMQQESSASHAAALVADWYHFGRVRPQAEILATVESLTAERLNAYAPQYVPPQKSDVLTITLGPTT